MAAAPRPTWQGHLRLSLVSCPVALYTATNAAGDVHFHLINPATNNRINMITVDPEAGPVKRGDLVKGFEVSKDKYVLFSNEELKSVKLESTKIIDIDRFVPAADIDRTYWDHPYFLAPDGKVAQEAFSVIREAMARTQQIALGRVVLATRERILAIEPFEKGMMAYSLRSKDEVRSAGDIFDSIGNDRPDEAMVAIAEKIIQQKEGPFDPSKFVDRYEDALKDLIKRKQKGEEVEEVDEPDNSNVIDLMDALRASLATKSGKTAKTPIKSAKKEPAKKALPKRSKAAG